MIQVSCNSNMGSTKNKSNNFVPHLYQLCPADLDFTHWLAMGSCWLSLAANMEPNHYCRVIEYVCMCK